MLALLGLVTAALFTGAALYVSFAEHPARMSLDDKAALAQWKPAYARGTILQASLALVSGAAGIGAWYRWMSMWPWLWGGIVMLSIIAYTFAVVWATNTKLKAAPEGTPETRALLTQWGMLHLGRTILAFVALGFFAYGFLPE